ncbi:hypothetical protein AOCH_003200 [Aspergillus ochraceoroseus]|uniref:Uncharacterized protein n=1 Tax=Aspergillus ochraceoroseus TaxID=138278 RepID=A0A0F8VN99_9EURO|nr:hypothetical protein AOCH_003200 [Aspergillus ochraceoroseus]
MRSLTLRGQRASKPEALICQLCQLSVSPTPRHYLQSSRSYVSPPRVSRKSNLGQLPSKKALKTPWTNSWIATRRYASHATEPTTSVDLSAALNEISEAANELRNSQTVPSNDAVVQVLQRCLAIAEVISQPEYSTAKNSSTSRVEDNEISSLLNLEEKNSTGKPPKRPRNVQQQQPSADALCRIIHDLLTDEKIFLSPEALSGYVKIHTLLKRPDRFPEIFHLYANKPIPEENSSPIKYLPASPKSINSAVPSEIANMALDVAIEQRNLALVLAIIDNTFCTPAFLRAKFFKKAAIPLGGLAATPAACYVAASWAATLQNTMDPGTATAIAFAATMAYVGGTSSVGLLAIITANDHMERVVWLPGVPLRHRWLHEEERAALDRVALAWGFKDVNMRGEEEGEEWENLREFIVGDLVF